MTWIDKVLLSIVEMLIIDSYDADEGCLNSSEQLLHHRTAHNSVSGRSVESEIFQTPCFDHS